MDGTLECAFDQLIWPCIRVRLADADLGLCLVNGSAKCATLVHCRSEKPDKATGARCNLALTTHEAGAGPAR